jgi:hypothetical protein
LERSSKRTHSRRALIERCSVGVSTSAPTVLIVAQAVQTRTWPKPTYRNWSAAYASVSTAATSARRPGASRRAKLPLMSACFAPRSEHVRRPAEYAETNASAMRHTMSTAGSAPKTADGARRLAALFSRHWADADPVHQFERNHVRAAGRRPEDASAAPGRGDTSTSSRRGLGRARVWLSQPKSHSGSVFPPKASATALARRPARYEIHRALPASRR